MITLQELINERLKIGRQINDLEVSDQRILKNLIDADRNSTQKKDMITAMAYYRVQNPKIMKRVKTYTINDKTFVDNVSANNKIAHAFHTILVDQKVQYIGVPKFNSDNTDFLERVQEILNYDEFEELISDALTNASNKGYDVIHPYIDEEDGKLKFTIIPAEECILIYDHGLGNRNLVALIRYYYVSWVDVEGKEHNRIRAEWWTKDMVTYFIESKEGGQFILDTEINPNPAYHIYRFNSEDSENMEGFSWGRPPFIILKNNTEMTTDLSMYKTLIDDYDFNKSEFSNELADLVQRILNLKDFDGEDLAEFMENLKRFRVVKTSGTGGVEVLDNNMSSKDSRESHLDRTFSDVFTFGMGVNPRMDKVENPSGVMLRILFSLLDLKANKSIRKLKRALSDLMWFISTYLELVEGLQYDPNDINFEINKTMYINESEIIDNLAKSTLSQETYLDKHPYVNDTHVELERLEREGEKEIDLNIEEEVEE